MKYSAKFYLEKRKEVIENVPVMLSVTYYGKQMFYYSGKRCDRKQWAADDKDKKSKGDTDQLKRNQTTSDGQSSVNFNSDLAHIKWAVGEVFKAYDVASIIPTTAQLREDLKTKLGRVTKVKDSETFFGRLKSFAKVVDRSKSSEGLIISVMEKMKKHDPLMTYETINLSELRRFMQKDCGHNTVAQYLIILKGFWTYALKNKFTTENPFESFEFDGPKYGRPIYINLKERDLLYNAVLPKKRQSVIRDIFLLQALTGCRFGDIQRLTHSSIIDGCLQYIAVKTKNKNGVIINVPLSEKAKTIIARYDLPGGCLVPKCPISIVDRALKKIFREVGLTRTVVVADKFTGIDTQVPICDIVGSHMARRVFVGGLYKQGVKNEIIASMSGHCKDSKAFGRYFDIDQEDKKAAMALIE